MSISKDEVERAIYRSRRKFQTDLASNIATATDNGIEIGLARGIEQGRVANTFLWSTTIAQRSWP